MSSKLDEKFEQVKGELETKLDHYIREVDKRLDEIRSKYESMLPSPG